MDLQSIGKIILIVGIVIAILGALLMLAGRLPFVSSLGSLPGDIQIEGQGFSCFVPILSMILLSIILTVILNIVIRFINRP
jgi:DUF2905 family protein